MAIAQPAGWMADLAKVKKDIAALQSNTFGRSGRNWGSARARNTATVTMGTESGNLSLNTWITNQGPSVSGIVVANGNLDIDITAKMVASGSSPVDLYVGAVVTGPTDVDPDKNDCLYIRFDATSGMSATQQSTYGMWLTGLDPGTYTVSLAYYTGSIGTPAGSGVVSNRAVKVQPY